MNDINERPVADKPASPPLLTAVMLMPGPFSILTASLASLTRQSIKDRIELVLVHTPAFRSSIDRSACEGFHSLKLVEVDRIPTIATGFVAGVAVATSTIVALVEDHVLLHPDWAERVEEAHRQDCAAVVPKMSNGNPATVSSWANFLVCFTEPFAMRAAGPVESGPGHNTSYKRAVLNSYRDELKLLYQSERNFHYRLKKDGHRFLAEPRAELAHINISLPRKILGHAFFGGVLFGQYRLAGMSLVERVARTIIAPFVPPIRFWRMARTLGFGRYVSPGTPRAAFIVAPVLLAIHATGEVVGYWRLLRDIEARYEHYELHRSECVQPIERPLMTARS